MEEYKLHNPSWRSPLRQDAAAKWSGWPDFYETHPGQDEDQLTEANVTRGYSGDGHVQAANPSCNSKPHKADARFLQSETFSAHSMIYEKLASSQILPDLVQLVSTIQDARNHQAASIEAHQFDLPGRTTLTQSKLESWFNDLGDSSVPLSKLAKSSVPRGYTNEKLLELFASKRVPIDRAVWCIRVIGANEIRAGSSQNPDRARSYNVEWTTTVCEAIRKLLNEIVLPSNVASAARVAIKGKVRATLTDPMLRQNWGSRFGYIGLLVRQLYSEGLLAPTTFLKWQIAQLQSVHFGQLPFVVHLIESYLDEHMECGHLCKEIVQFGLQRLKDIDEEPLGALLVDIRIVLHRLFENIMVLHPAAFVQPSIHARFSDQLHTCFTAPSIRLHISESESAVLSDKIMSHLAHCVHRASRLLCRQIDQVGDRRAGSDLHLIEILDGVRFPSDLAESSSAFFGEDEATLRVRVELLLTWAVTSARSSPSQPYVAASMLLQRGEAHSKVHSTQNILSEWIGKNADSSLQPNSVLRLFSELIRVGLFSYNQYYDSMVSSGQTEIAFNSEGRERRSLHQLLLTSLQQSALQPAASRRRRHAVDPKQELLEDSLLKDIYALLVSPSHAEFRLRQDVLENLESFGSRWRISDAISSTIESMDHLSEHSWSCASVLLIALQDYFSLFKICKHALLVGKQRVLIARVVDVTGLYIDVWSALGVLQDLALALLAVHARLYRIGAWPLAGTDLLIDLELNQCCSTEIRRCIHGATPMPVLSAEESGRDSPVDLVVGPDMSTDDCEHLVKHLLRQNGVMDFAWVENLCKAAIKALQSDSTLLRPWVDVFAGLSEVPQIDIGKTCLSLLGPRTETLQASEENLILMLVAQDVLNLSLLVSSCLLPLMTASFHRLLDDAKVEAVKAVELSKECDLVVRLLHSLSPTPRLPLADIPDFQVGARWRSLLHSEAFIDLARLFALIILHEGATPDESSTKAKRRDIMSMESIKGAFVKNGHRALGAMLEISSQADKKLQGYLLEQLAEWMRPDGLSGSRTSNQALTNLEPLTAKWHIASIQIEMQLQLEQAMLAGNDTTRSDEILEHLILDSDVSVAESLITSVSAGARVRLYEALIGRVSRTLEDTSAQQAQWRQISDLCRCLLQNESVFRPLQPSSSTLAILLEAIQRVLRAFIVDNGGSCSVERSVFGLCVALRCDAKALDACQDGFAEIAKLMVQVVVKTQHDTFANEDLHMFLTDCLSFLLDGQDLTSTAFSAASGALADSTKALNAGYLEWLLRPAPADVADALPLMPWELFEVSPLPRLNSTALDLASLHARLLGTGLASRQKPDPVPAWINHAGYPQGAQSRFDSEWPLLRESVSYRDFRRGILEDPPAVQSPSQPIAPKEVIDVDQLSNSARGTLKRKATDEGKMALKKTVSGGKAKQK